MAVGVTYIYGLGLSTSIYVWYNQYGTSGYVYGKEIGTVATTEQVYIGTPAYAGTLYQLSSSSESLTPITDYKIKSISNANTNTAVSQVDDVTFKIDSASGSPSAILTLTLEPATSKLSIDLSTLSGWQYLSEGDHIITFKALADGYFDGELSEGISVTKEASFFNATFTAEHSSTYNEANVKLYLKIDSDTVSADDYDYFIKAAMGYYRYGYDGLVKGYLTDLSITGVKKIAAIMESDEATYTNGDGNTYTIGSNSVTILVPYGSDTLFSLVMPWWEDE